MTVFFRINYVLVKNRRGVCTSTSLGCFCQTQFNARVSPRKEESSWFIEVETRIDLWQFCKYLLSGRNSCAHMSVVVKNTAILCRTSALVPRFQRF